MKVYYAHPMVVYGTRREHEELDIIKRRVLDAEIVNPARYSGDPGKTHEHMEFYHELVDECDVVVYSDVVVGEEVEYALEKGKPVYRIDHKTRRLVRVHGEAKHLSRTGTRLLYRTMKWSGLRGEDLNKIVRMKIAEFGGRLSEEDALLMVAADLGVNTKAYLNNALREKPERINAKKSEGPNYKDAETLRRLYWEEGLSTYRMAELLGVDHTTVLYWLRKRGVSVRGVSEALEKYPKIPFPDDPVKKAYGLGLRAGDIHAEERGRNNRFSTTTTTGAMRNIVRNFLGRYGHYHEYPMFNKKMNKYEWRIDSYVDGESSRFMLEKPTEVPKGELFYPFLVGYADSEGNWTISHRGDKTLFIAFQLKTTDTELLRQIAERLEEDGSHPKFKLVEKAGAVSSTGVRTTKDTYRVALWQGREAVRLAEKLLPIYETANIKGNEEKIAWMKLVLEVKNETRWVDVEYRVNTLREEMDKETKECMKEAEEEYKRRHGGRDWFEAHGHRKSGDGVKKELK